MKLIALFLLLMTFNALAVEGTGSHGGDGQMQDQILRLRDLIDPRDCQIKSGARIFREEKELTTVLKVLSKGNSYLAYKLESEIKKVQWCFTGILKKIDTQDIESDLVTYYADSESKVQIGIRVADTVFVNKEALKLLHYTDRPYFFIHEAIHGLIPVKTRARNMKVRSSIAAIRDLVEGVSEAQDLDFALQFSEVDSAKSGEFVQVVAQALLTLDKTEEERTQMLRAISFSTVDNQASEQLKSVLSFLNRIELSLIAKRTELARWDLLWQLEHMYMYARGYGYLSSSHYVSFDTGSFGRCSLSVTNDFLNYPNGIVLKKKVNGREEIVVKEKGSYFERHGYQVNLGEPWIASNPIFTALLLSDVCDK